MTENQTYPSYRFDQIAQMISERVDPAEVEIDRYVGLEHLSSESLQIKRWGTPNDVIGTKLRFYKGDVIFGRRRAYQRKLAIADFEGICSAHAMVLRANSNVCLPEFLPFFMSSEIFFERALTISVGSLSPTINWKTLAKQEFPLPPIPEQRRIAEILWAADDMVEKFNHLLGIFRTSRTKIIDQELFTGSPPEVELGKLVLNKPEYGINAAGIEHKPGEPRFIRITDIDDYGNLLDDEILGVDEHKLDEFILEEGDLLFARTGSVGKTYLYKESDGFAVFAGYLIRFRLDIKKVLPRFVFYFSKSSAYKKWILQTMRVGVQPNINANEYASLKIPLPSLSKQHLLITSLSSLDEKIEELNHHINIITYLKKTLVEELL